MISQLFVQIQSDYHQFASFFPWKTLKNQSGWTPEKSYSSVEINLGEHLTQIVFFFRFAWKTKDGPPMAIETGCEMIS